jgi:integrase
MIEAPAKVATAQKKSSRRGQGWLYQRGSVWWLQWSHRGRVHRESAKSEKRSVAVKLLQKRMGEIGKGRVVGPDLEKTTFEELREMLLADYRLNGRKSLERAETSMERLAEKFAGWRAIAITYVDLLAYADKRKEEGKAQATIQNEFAALKRAFQLAKKARKAEPPDFPTVVVSNARKGFFSRGDFEAVRSHLPDYLQPIVTFMFLTGWRRSETLSLQWRQIDLKAGEARLEPGTTKNNEARTFPFKLLPELEATMKEQRERTESLMRETGTIIPWVFHRSGKQIASFRKCWKKACDAAGLAGRIPHDFRRSAVRNLNRAGVPRSTAMKLTGHKTESVYLRYSIVSASDLAEGVEKLARLDHDEKKSSTKQGAVEPRR